jgi:prolyl oligopeptidase
MAFSYPKTTTVDQIDDYHGTRVADPYRWLEEDLAPDTMAWVDAQNALTRSILDGPRRDTIRARLAELYNYPRTGLPQKRGRRYFFTHNTGLQNQPVLHVREGVSGDARVLLDPNALATDGTAALTALEPDEQGDLLAYGLSKSGSDVQEIRVRDIASGLDRDDRLDWVKFATIAWLRDSSGFYYTRFPAPGTVVAGDENYFQRVYFHRLGDPQDRDRLICERTDDKEIVFAVDLSDDDRYLVISSNKGSSDKSEVHVVDRHAADAAPKPLFTGFASAYELIDAVTGRLFFKTDEQAPMGRVIAVDLADSTSASRPHSIRPTSCGWTGVGPRP